jgi:hypothetical protein
MRLQLRHVFGFLLMACSRTTTPDPSVDAPVVTGSPAGKTAALRFPSEHLSFTPLPGWTDRRAEEAKRFVDADAGAEWKKPEKGELFQLNAPLGSGFSSVTLGSVEVPADSDPVLLLQTASDAFRKVLAKTSYSYTLVVPPRPVRSQSLRGAEMYERWEMSDRWQRTVQRIFMRAGRAYLLRCDWSDKLGDDPPGLQRVLDGLQFDS